jgi:tRNA(fMet)-specific endonuclease VapC
MYCYMLDTDIASYIMKRSNDAVLRKLQVIPVAEMCISAIAESELRFGVAVSPRRRKDQEALEELLRYLSVLDYPAAASQEFGEIRAELKARGMIVDTNDLLIAAHARCLSLTLVTNNTREFSRVPGLKVEDWA